MLILNQRSVESCRKNNAKVNALRKTHLYMNNKGIREIGDISKFSNLSVLYLHNNKIQDIGKLSDITTLTYLFLQWNRITTLSNLTNLPNLKNLYLAYNQINTLDGLKSMPNLQVLHIQKQNFTNQALEFDPETVSSLSKSLIELNISGNGLTTLENLQPLHNLVYVDASDNLLANIKTICNTIRKWRQLKSLQIYGNMFSKIRKYEYDIISSAFRLEFLNGKEVSPTVSQFLHALENMKSKRERKKERRKGTEFSLETRSFVHQLPLEFREIVSRSIIHNRE